MGQVLIGLVGGPSASLADLASSAQLDFMPPPSVPVVASFQVQAWNSLQPLFQLFSQSYASGPWGQAKTAIQSLLGIQLVDTSTLRPAPTGDWLLDMVDDTLYSGQPLTAGSMPLYRTYWDGVGHTAQDALAMSAPYIQGLVTVAAFSWVLPGLGYLGVVAVFDAAPFSCVATNVLMGYGFGVGGNVAGQVAQNIDQGIPWYQINPTDVFFAGAEGAGMGLAFGMLPGFAQRPLGIMPYAGNLDAGFDEWEVETEHRLRS